VDKGSDLLLMFAAVFIYYALGIGLLISGFFFFRWVIRPTGLRSDFPRLIAEISDLTIQSIDNITDLFHQFIQSIGKIPTYSISSFKPSPEFRIPCANSALKPSPNSSAGG
jgi:hypothetical protein